MKIDTTKIVGFDEMSAEEKIKALTEYEVDVPDNSAEINRYKKLISDANGEAAKYKKQLNERPTTDDMASLKEQVATLQRDKTISEYKSNYIALGYSEELATTTAIAMVDGDMATVFANQKAFNDATKSEYERQKVVAQPTPTSGKPVDDFEAEKARTNRLLSYAKLATALNIFFII